MRDSGTLANPKRHRRDSFTGATTCSMTGSTSGKGDAPPTLSQSVSDAAAPRRNLRRGAGRLRERARAEAETRFPDRHRALGRGRGTTSTVSTSGASEVCLRSAKGDHGRRDGILDPSHGCRESRRSGRRRRQRRKRRLDEILNARRALRREFALETLLLREHSRQSSSACAMIRRGVPPRRGTRANRPPTPHSPSPNSHSSLQRAHCACAHTHSDCIFSASIFIRSALSSRSDTPSSTPPRVEAYRSPARLSPRSRAPPQPSPASPLDPLRIDPSQRLVLSQSPRARRVLGPLSAFASASAHARESASTCRRKCLSSSRPRSRPSLSPSPRPTPRPRPTSIASSSSPSSSSKPSRARARA